MSSGSLSTMIDRSPPLAAIWTTFNGDRGTKSKPVSGPHQVYGFLTTSPNAVVEPIHPKAMPVILTPTNSATSGCEPPGTRSVAAAPHLQTAIPAQLRSRRDRGLDLLHHFPEPCGQAFKQRARLPVRRCSSRTSTVVRLRPKLV
jgi:hypothetical protein